MAWAPQPPSAAAPGLGSPKSAAGAEARTTTVERVGFRVRSAMKPMPHASFSLAGSYSPTFFGAVVTPAVRCASADMAPTHGAKSPESAGPDRSSANLFVEMASLAKCHALRWLKRARE